MLALVVSLVVANSGGVTLLRVSGASGVAPGNGPEAEEAAHQDACRRGVLEALGQASPTASPSVLHELGPALDELLANPCGRIAEDRTEKRHVDHSDKGLTRVTLALASVITEPLYTQYQAAVAQVVARPHPRVMLLLSERSAGGDHAWWVAAPAGSGPAPLHFSLAEQDLAAALSSCGWHVLPPEQAVQMGISQVLIKGSSPTVPEAVAYAKAAGVDYVVLGHVSFTAHPANSMMRIFPSEVVAAVHIARVSSAEVVGSVELSEIVPSVMNENDAMLRAAVVAADRIDSAMVTEVLPDWQTTAAGTGRFAVDVRVEDFGQLQALVGLIKAQPGVTSAEAGEFAAGHALVTVVLTAIDTKKLAAALSGKSAGGGTVHITGVSSAQLALKVAK